LIILTHREHHRLHAASDFLRLHKKTILLIVTVVAITLLVSAAISIMLDSHYAMSLPSVGNLRTVGVKAYYDQALQNQTTTIDWGTVYTGSSYNVTLYLQSTSNVQTTLSLTTANWTYTNTNNTIVSGPADSTPYINLTWNYDNETLVPNQTVPITLTLTTNNSPGFITFLVNNSIKQFAMDITIQANET
jgi:hypothetical protein